MKNIKYNLASDSWDDEEIKAINEVISSNRYTMGDRVKKFESEFANFFGSKYSIMVNSGSSANLLALSSFNFKKGSEIITPNLTFSTTVAPIYQLGLVPHFVGADDNKFVTKCSQIEKCINKKTVALMIPNLLGNIADWKKIYKIANKYKLKIIEDSADTIGYKVNGKNLGKYSDVTTNSFYASHIINGAGTGGIVCFNDYKLYKKAKLLRGWGRSSAVFNESENVNKRFNVKISGIDYDAKYIFSDLGYNFLPSEISAAFALEQIKKLKNNISIRNKNFEYLKKFFNGYKNYFKLPEQYKGVKTPWLAFPLVIKKNKKFTRKKMQIFFEKNHIQTRTIFTGNILKQPVMKNKIYKKHPNCDKIADDVMKNGILLGCHQGMNLRELNYICSTFKKLIGNEDNQN